MVSTQRGKGFRIFFTHASRQNCDYAIVKPLVVTTTIIGLLKLQGALLKMGWCSGR